MLKRSASDLIRRLQRYGMRFRSFSMTHEGDYTVDDADWNYKDVPHLQYVHQLVEAVYGAVDDRYIATINLQRVLGMQAALTVFNYESGPNEQTYFTSFLFFVLIIHTRYETLGELRCRVTTTYSFGAPPWLIWLFPLARWVLARNYKDLMSGDIPMRERRGQLRKWGGQLMKPGESYSFRKTMELTSCNVVFPGKAGTPTSSLGTTHVAELPATGELLLGRSDHLGIRVLVSGEKVQGFPRLCVHEGAGLDEAQCSDGVLICPWHGRRIKPLFDLSRTSMRTEAVFQLGGDAAAAEVVEGRLIIKPCASPRGGHSREK